MPNLSGWTLYQKGLEKGVENSTKFISRNMGGIPMKAIFLTALSPYFYESIKTDEQGNSTLGRYVSAQIDPETTRSTGSTLPDIPLYKAISPLKLLNPFKAIEVACLLIQRGLSALIDRIAGKEYRDMRVSEPHPVAKAIKFLLLPVTLLNILVSPLASIERIPPFQKLAHFLGIKGPLEKEGKESKQGSSATENLSSSTKPLLAEDRVHTPEPKSHLSSEAMIFNKLQYPDPQQVTKPKVSLEEKQQAVLAELKQKHTRNLPKEHVSKTHEDESEGEREGESEGIRLH